MVSRVLSVVFVAVDPLHFRPYFLIEFPRANKRKKRSLGDCLFGSFLVSLSSILVYNEICFEITQLMYTHKRHITCVRGERKCCTARTFIWFFAYFVIYLFFFGKNTGISLFRMPSSGCLFVCLRLCVRVCVRFKQWRQSYTVQLYFSVSSAWYVYLYFLLRAIQWFLAGLCADRLYGACNLISTTSV